MQAIRIMFRRILAPALAPALLFAATAVRADVRPYVLFSDGAVLQQGIKVPVWGTARDDEKVTVAIAGQKVSTVAKKGQWQVALNPLRAGGPFTMTISGDNKVEIKNVLVGEVWVCSGQSNMEFPLRGAANATEAIAASADPMLHLLTVARRTADAPLKDLNINATMTSQWTECNPQTVPDFTAVGYFFGRDLRKALKVPVGLIHSSWGGTYAEAWTSPAFVESNPKVKTQMDAYALEREAYFRALNDYPKQVEMAKAEGKPEPKRPADPLGNPNKPSHLYNAMIEPLLPYAIRGAIWYQGESNAGAAYDYQTTFPTMINSWRKGWGEGDFPFLFVQLAPFQKINADQHDSAWAELREAQRLTTLNLPNAGMAVITDVGDEKNIHPTRKEPVGARLALLALNMVYHKRGPATGPWLESAQPKGNAVVVKFKNTGGGLMAQGGAELTGFAIAGSDGKFVNAQAKIVGNTVVVSSPDVAKPVAVRYGWADFPLGNLWSKEGLPASPFRTDTFPMITQK